MWFCIVGNLEHELKRRARSLLKCSGVAQACSSLSFSIVDSTRLRRRLWQRLASTSVRHWFHTSKEGVFKTRGVVMLAMWSSRRVVHLDGNMEFRLKRPSRFCLHLRVVNRDAKCVVAHSDVLSWAQVVVQLFRVLFGANKMIPRYEDMMLCCCWCRAVGF